MTFARQLRRWREIHKLRQEDLAKRLGISKHTLWMWENGYVPSSLAQVGARFLMSANEIAEVVVRCPRYFDSFWR